MTPTQKDTKGSFNDRASPAAEKYVPPMPLHMICPCYRPKM